MESCLTQTLANTLSVYKASTNNIKFRTACSPKGDVFVYLFLCLFYFGKYTLMKSTESLVVLHRQMTWNEIDPQVGFSSCLRTCREVECKTQSFLIYFYLGGFGSYSKLMCSIKDRTESVQDATQVEIANWKYFPESASDPRGGLSHPQC